jgi:uncharacterized protein (DUF1778 family)
MAKTRFSISLDPEQAERIRTAAAEGGQELSAFLLSAGLVEAARRERAARACSDTDGAIAAAERAAEEIDWSAGAG